MKKIKLALLFLMIMSIGIHAKTTIFEDNNISTIDKNIKIKTVRKVLGTNDPIAHSKGQLRTGFITFQEEGSDRTSAYGLGGHFHFDTKRWNGLAIGLSAYTVLNMGIKQNPSYLNGDFFDAKGKSFMALTEAYLDGKWGETEIKLGRQILDTPHADSDDIRMIPNYFEAYTFSNTDVDNLTLKAGLITKMAGWENGIDSSHFKKTSEVLGVEKTEGIFYASARYDGIKELSASLWYYNYLDIAEVLYAEIAYHLHISDDFLLTTGLQYDGSRESGQALLGQQDAQTYGLSLELDNEALGLHILAAYNRDNGSTGAFGLSLGGGPFFTSMEDQTLDAIEGPGRSWLLGFGYHFDTVGLEGLALGVAYGDFKAKNDADYASNEMDIALDYIWSKKLTLTAAYASVRFDTDDANYDQLRVFANYSF